MRAMLGHQYRGACNARRAVVEPAVRGINVSYGSKPFQPDLRGVVTQARWISRIIKAYIQPQAVRFLSTSAFSLTWICGGR